MTVTIQVHHWLPSGTIIVSSDIAEILHEQYSEAGQDAAFLKALGIVQGTLVKGDQYREGP